MGKWPIPQLPAVIGVSSCFRPTALSPVHWSSPGTWLHSWRLTSGSISRARCYPPPRSPGGVGGLVFGGFIDAGHTGRAVGLNAWVLTGLVLLKAVCVGDPVAMATAALISNALGGLYLPTLMTAIYNEAKAAPCTLRFHFATEGGWDAGGSVACLVAAAAWSAGVPPSFVLLLSLFGIAAQARLLWRRYDAHALATGSNN